MSHRRALRINRESIALQAMRELLRQGWLQPTDSTEKRRVSQEDIANCAVEMADVLLAALAAVPATGGEHHG